MVLVDSWKKLNYLQICAEGREVRGHWQKERRMLTGVMRLVFPFSDLGACSGGKARLAGRFRGGGRT